MKKLVALAVVVAMVAGISLSAVGCGKSGDDVTDNNGSHAGTAYETSKEDISLDEKTEAPTESKASETEAETEGKALFKLWMGEIIGSDLETGVYVLTARYNIALKIRYDNSFLYRLCLDKKLRNRKR